MRSAKAGKPSRARAGVDSAAIVAKPSSAAAAATMVSAIFGPTPGRSWATRKPATRSRGFSAKRISATASFTCAASRNFRPPIFDERHVAAGELEFERGAVVGGAKQHRLAFQRSARLAIGEDAGRDEARLIGVVGDGDERGKRARAAGRSKGSWRSARARAQLPRWRRRGRRRSSGSCARASRTCAGGSKARGKSRMLRTVAARKE